MTNISGEKIAARRSVRRHDGGSTVLPPVFTARCAGDLPFLRSASGSSTSTSLALVVDVDVLVLVPALLLAPPFLLLRGHRPSLARSRRRSPR